MSDSKSKTTNYEDMITVIIDRDQSSTLPILEKNKFLVPRHMMVGAFIVSIRRKLNVSGHKTIVVSTKQNNYTPPANITMEALYLKYKSDDNYLYLTYKDEKFFG